MTKYIKDTLTTARNVLWKLLVQHEKSEIDLGDMRQHVDFAERDCADTLKRMDEDTADDTPDE